MLRCSHVVWCNTGDQKQLALVGTDSMSQGIDMIWFGQRPQVTSHDFTQNDASCQEFPHLSECSTLGNDILNVDSSSWRSIALSQMTLILPAKGRYRNPFGHDGSVAKQCADATLGEKMLPIASNV